MSRSDNVPVLKIEVDGELLVRRGPAHLQHSLEGSLEVGVAERVEDGVESGVEVAAPDSGFKYLTRDITRRTVTITVGDNLDRHYFWRQIKNYAKSTIVIP